VTLAVRARRVLLPDGERAATVHTSDGVITAVTGFGDAPAGAVTLADDEVLLPGLVDSHVHVNEPGAPSGRASRPRPRRPPPAASPRSWTCR
jgi:allantoinase